jgi:hypothetical protein
MDEPQKGQNWNSAGLSRLQFGHVATIRESTGLFRT